MTEFLLSIDPGKSSGVALLAYDDSSVTLEGAWQFPGGAKALAEWTRDHWRYKLGLILDPSGSIPVDNLEILCEKFTARATKGFSYTTASLEPLRCEGVLLALGVMPDYTPAEKRWRDPGLQYLVGGKDKADKKKRQAAFLKDSGFYVTGKDFGTPDADDFRSACAHGIAFLLREKKNKVAYDMVTDWTEAHG